jgi:hypothetical protein
MWLVMSTRSLLSMASNNGVVAASTDSAPVPPPRNGAPPEPAPGAVLTRAQPLASAPVTRKPKKQVEKTLENTPKKPTSHAEVADRMGLPL